MEVSKEEFYKKISTMDVISRAERYWSDFVIRHTGVLVGRICDSIGIREDEEYYVSTYYLIKP